MMESSVEKNDDLNHNCTEKQQHELQQVPSNSKMSFDGTNSQQSNAVVPISVPKKSDIDPQILPNAQDNLLSTNSSTGSDRIGITPPNQTDRKKRRRQQPFLVVSMNDTNSRRVNHDRQQHNSFHPWSVNDRSIKSKIRTFWGNDDDDDDENDADDDWLYHQQHHMAYVTPDFNHWFQLTMALLLCTSMAILSAYDAEIHCLQHEIYAVLQLVNDDDEAIQDAYEAAYNAAIDNETMKCIHMFQRVVLPMCGSSAICAVISLLIIYVYNFINKRRRRDIKLKDTEATKIPNINNSGQPPLPCDSDSQSSASGPITNSAKAILRPYIHHWSTVVSITISLFVLYIIILGLQTYNVTAVMLKPRTDDTNSNYYNSGLGGGEDSSNNPYQSLAAVDRFGHVGDNANLYYLSWLSFGLSIALVYQVSTSCFRVIRAAKRQQEYQNDGIYNTNKSQYDPTAYAKSNENETYNKSVQILSPPSWDESSGRNYHRRYKKRRKLLVDQSRAAWYSSLYRLRVRTGIWTATCITCWILVASSQYIWRQTLWPSLLQQRNYYHNNKYRNNFYSNSNTNTNSSTNDHSLFSYFSVCHQSSSYSSSAANSNNNFTPQLCRRTLAAWIVGFVAAVLCAAAIVMHVAARYFNKNQVNSYRLPAKVVHAAVTQIPIGDDNRVKSSTTTTPGVDAKSLTSTSDYYDHDVIQLLTHRTDVWKNASPSTLLSRYYSHIHPNRLPLRTEILLGIILSFMLGVNAVMVTGVEGPALKVGNLYYASWISFLLCVRICLGCIEEYFNVDEEDDEDEGQSSSQASENHSATMKQNTVCDDAIHEGKQRSFSYEPPSTSIITKKQDNGAGLQELSVSNTASNIATPTGNGSVNSKDLATISVDSANSAAEKQEKKRIGRVRNYFFLSIFSTVCGASSYDAASNQDKSLTREQMYMMYAPCVVAVISYILFGLSLSKKCYTIISRFWIGGVLSIVSFSILLGDLLLTMHSEDSWAVNNIGEIAMANLYYFAWASIFTAGVQMSSYVKALLGIRKLDHMSALWAAICKVCFIILGASLHIWHTISDNCEFDEITLGAVTFCSRTVLAITVSLTGMLVGGLVVLGRILIMLCPNCHCARFQSHIEMLISLFLVFLFVAAVALITGIGGPGQSVGDLYYSTWGAFWVSIGIFVSCYHQLNEEEKEVEGDAVKSDAVMV